MWHSADLWTKYRSTHSFHSGRTGCGPSTSNVLSCLKCNSIVFAGLRRGLTIEITVNWPRNSLGGNCIDLRTRGEGQVVLGFRLCFCFCCRFLHTMRWCAAAPAAKRGRGTGPHCALGPPLIKFPNCMKTVNKSLLFERKTLQNSHFLCCVGLCLVLYMYVALRTPSAWKQNNANF